MKKNILALIMAVCLMVTALPIDVLAESPDVWIGNVDPVAREIGEDGEADLPDFDEGLDLFGSEGGDAPPEETDDMDLSAIYEDVPNEYVGEVGGEADVPPSGDASDETPDGLSADGADSVPVSDDPSEELPPDDAQDGADAPEGAIEGSADLTAEAPAQTPGDAGTQDDGGEAVPGEEGDIPADTDAHTQPGEQEEPASDETEEGDAGEPDTDAPETDADKATGETDADGDAAEDIPGEGDADKAPDGTDETPEEAEKAEGEESPDGTDKAEGEEGDGKQDEETSGSESQEEDGKASGEDAEAAEGAEADEPKEPGEDEEKAEAETEGSAEEAAADQLNEVMEPGPAFSLDPATLSLPMQESYAIKANGGTGAITWKSENTGVATVDAQGNVTAVAMGSARIVATDETSASAYCDVTVVEVPADVAFESASLVLGLRERRQLPRIVWAGGTKEYKGTVTFDSKAKKKVTVTADGAVKGVARGSAVITASLPDGKVLECAVTVKKAPGKITVKPKKRSMGVGESLTLEYTLPAACGGSVTWSSGNAGVVSVNPETGVVTALAAGTARVTARTYNNKRASVTISVYAAPTSVAFDSKVISVGLGETTDLCASVNEGAYSNFSFATADGGIAPIANGRITGAALGETQVTVTTYNNLQDTATIVVKPAPTTISLPYKTLRIGRGDSVRIQANLGDGASSLICRSSKKKIVKVVGNGVVKGLKRGTSYVTVRTFNGLRARLKVVVKGAPGSVTATPAALNLGLGETYTLKYKTPAGTAGSVRFTGDAPSIFSVNETTGEITGLATGSGTVTLTTYNGKTTTCPVTVYNAPTEMAFDPAQTSVGKKQKLQLQMKFNEGGWANPTFESDNPRVAKVTPDGLVTGVSVGQTVIRARAYVPGLVAETVFTVWGSPSRVWVDKKSMTVNVGETLQLEPRTPVGSKTTFKYKSSNRKVATVNADGLVTPKKKGKVNITITTHNKKKCTVKLTVRDPGRVTSVKLKDGKAPVLNVGDTWQAECVVKPATAAPQLSWSSSNPAVATVNETGFVTAVGYGVTTISATPASNPKAALTFSLSVQTVELALAIPARTTDVAGIPGNLAMINAIRSSTLSEIDRLAAAGSLSGESAARRKEIVESIFTNYAFPWMTPSLQKYWKAANSENGRKDFKAGVVYYGLPYISGSGANRRYSAALALSESRYTDSGQGYYVLNKGNYLNGKYVGNDCSGLVNVSIWGTGSSHSADRTADIAVSTAYRTIASYEEMLPGDLICKGNAHVVMFLYYASTDKSKIMIIENGGSEKGTNTVHCDIYNASSYKKSGYKVRRLASL